MSESDRTNNGEAVLGSWLARFRNLPNDSIAKSVLVTFAVCVFASLLVSITAVLLRPAQEKNKAAEQWRQISGILDDANSTSAGRGANVPEGMKFRVVELATGEYADQIDPATFTPQGVTDPSIHRIAIPAAQDIALIQNRLTHAVVRTLEKNGAPEIVILPVYGRGYASVLRGYLGLSGDTETVIGLAFYEHAETPGLGALIDTPQWRQLWRGKKVWGDDGEVLLGVASGPVLAGTDEALHQVDGLTGATWTGQGVTNLLHYWLGDHGFGLYLRKLRRAAK